MGSEMDASNTCPNMVTIRARVRTWSLATCPNMVTVRTRVRTWSRPITVRALVRVGHAPRAFAVGTQYEHSTSKSRDSHMGAFTHSRVACWMKSETLATDRTCTSKQNAPSHWNGHKRRYHALSKSCVGRREALAHDQNPTIELVAFVTKVVATHCSIAHWKNAQHSRT